MNKNEAKERIDKLKLEINRYRHSYHVLDKSLISDEALDSLKKELFDLEADFPELVTPDSPTQRVAGEPAKQFNKVRHIEPMLSLNDVFSEKDLRDWLERVENYLETKVAQVGFYCELKIDGLAVELVYVDGVLTQASTRGDGLVGEDVTQNIKTIEAIPLKLVLSDKPIANSIPKRLVVRGEIFISRKEFERVNREQEKKGEKVYANPRNIAAGSIRQLDPRVTAARRLDSFAYDVISSEGPEIGFKTHEEKHDYLKNLGFKTNPDNIGAWSVEEVVKLRDYWDEHRNKLGYEVDGLVVIINDESLFTRAGVIGKAPRAAAAFKFSPREATTIVEDVVIQVGRTGALTPVAKLKPVTVAGITISSATLHNYDEIKRLGLKMGDTVVVSRAGDVIPQITSVLKDLRTGKEKAFHMPERCPVDGSKVDKDGVAYRCSNPDCGARLREALYHFVSRNAYDIRGLGAKVIDRFLDEGLITDAADLFDLKKGDIAVLERFGETSAENIVGEIQSKKKVTLPRFIYGLGILHVGEETALLLAKQITNNKKQITKPSDVLEVFQKMSLDNLQEIRDVGPKVAQSIYDWFKNKKHIALLEKFEKVGVEIEASLSVSPGASRLAGKKFVITGTLSGMSREEAKEKIRAAGGETSESVSSQTDYLVAGENSGSKLNKAEKLGVKIIDKEGLLDMLK